MVTTVRRDEREDRPDDDEIGAEARGRPAIETQMHCRKEL